MDSHIGFRSFGIQRLICSPVEQLLYVKESQKSIPVVLPKAAGSSKNASAERNLPHGICQSFGEILMKPSTNLGFPKRTANSIMSLVIQKYTDCKEEPWIRNRPRLHLSWAMEERFAVEEEVALQIRDRRGQRERMGER